MSNFKKGNVGCIYNEAGIKFNFKMKSFYFSKRMIKLLLLEIIVTDGLKK